MAIETFLTHHGWIVGAGVSEYQDMLQPIDTLAECKAVWAKASPAERAGCLEFIKANSERRMGDSGKKGRDTPRTASTSGGNPLGVGGAWGFVRCTNLDTGRKFLAAALWLDNKGLTLNQLRGVVGLPKVKGGDVVAKGPPAISLGNVEDLEELMESKGVCEDDKVEVRKFQEFLRVRKAGEKLTPEMKKYLKGEDVQPSKPKLMSREQAKRLGLLNSTKSAGGAAMKGKLLAKPKRRHER